MKFPLTLGSALGVLLLAGVGRAQPVRTFAGHAAPVSAVAFRPDGVSLASASFDGTVKVWDVAAGTVTRTLRGHRDKVLALAYSPDGRRLASAGLDGAVNLWDVAGG